MNFIIENGTGLTNSTSYVSEDYFREYWEDLGVTLAETDDVIAGWLNEATRYIDLSYNFFSTPTTESLVLFSTLKTKTQALEFPRVLWGTELPIELKKGLCEIAYARQGQDPDRAVQTNIASESYGPVSVSYKSGTNKTFYKTANLWLFKICYAKTRRVSPT